MAYALYDFGPSPFCIKVRAILDYKGLAYQRWPITEPRHLLTLRLRSRTGKVPALLVDGDLVVDSTDIALALDERHPSPPLLPADPVLRAQCVAYEEWADESLYFIGLYYRWKDAEGRAAAGDVFPAPIRPFVMAQVYMGSTRNLHGQGTGRKSPDHVRRDLDRQLGAVSTLVDRAAYLLGEAPFLCD